MKVLVIGAGFVGQGIIQRLSQDGHAVLVWSNLVDLYGLVALMIKHAPSAVILAAGSPQHEGFHLDRRTLIDHVMVAECVAACAGEIRARVVVISSTLVLAPTRTGYGVLKLLVEHVVGGPSTVILRAGTVVHDLHDRNQSVLHAFVRAAARGGALPVHGGSANRTVYLVTRDHLAREVAQVLTRVLPVGPSIVALWNGTVQALARLVQNRASKGGEPKKAQEGILATIDTMIVQARSENP